MSCPILELAQQLIKCPSLTPNDAGCQSIISSRLQTLGFTVEPMLFNNTHNIWAWRGKGGSTLAFAGHTDVVLTGNIKYWDNPPFEPTLRNGLLYGRGAADMKGSLAAMVIAVERFVKKYPHHHGRLAFLITSDEEASAKDGTVKIVETLMIRKEKINYCLIGEPSSIHQVGDVIKNGRRGSLTANLVVHGVQGHVAYPQLVKNPVHCVINTLKELVETKWDNGNIFFPPTTMQIISINANSGSNNITPDKLKVQFNFRFNTESSEVNLRQRVENIIHKHGLCYHIDWLQYAEPFLTARGKLVDATVNAIKHYQKLTPRLEATGGTSDGRFIARMGAQIVELGPVNTTIHKVNECVSITDLQLLSLMYQYIMEQLILF